MKRDTPEVALRQAALDWALNAQAPVRTYDDREFKRVDRKLQRAAIRYAESVRKDPFLDGIGKEKADGPRR